MNIRYPLYEGVYRILTILCAVISLLFACFMCYLWTDAAKDRDNYKQYYEYYQEQAREQKGNK